MPRSTPRTRSWRALRPTAADRALAVRVLGIDLGSRRVGIAVGDTGTGVATPVTVLVRSADLPADRRRIEALVTEWEADCVVVGLPLSLDGSAGPAAVAADAEMVELTRVLPVPVIAHDERLSTVSAHHALSEAGLSSRDRRDKVDAVAAAVLLQDWLDRHAARHDAGPPGAPDEPGAAPT